MYICTELMEQVIIEEFIDFVLFTMNLAETTASSGNIRLSWSTNVNALYKRN